CQKEFGEGRSPVAVPAVEGAMVRIQRVLSTIPRGVDDVERRQCSCVEGDSLMAWIRDRALTLALMAMFLLFLSGQLLTGFAEYDSEQAQHGLAAGTISAY